MKVSYEGQQSLEKKKAETKPGEVYLQNDLYYLVVDSDLVVNLGFSTPGYICKESLKDKTFYANERLAPGKITFENI